MGRGDDHRLAIDSPASILAVVGFSCYILWELLGIFRSLPFLEANPTSPTGYSGRVVAFFVLALCFGIAVVVGKRKRHYSARPLVICSSACSALVLMISIVTFFTSIPPVIAILAWWLYAISVASLMMAWAIYFCARFDVSTPTVITTSYIVAFALLLSFSLFSSSMGKQSYFLVGVIASFISIRFLVILFKTRSFNTAQASATYNGWGDETEHRTHVDTAPKKDGFIKKFPFPRELYAVVYGIGFGFAITFLLSMGRVGAIGGATGGLMGSLAGICVVKSRQRRSREIRRITFIPVVISFLFLPLCTPPLQVVCCIPIVFATIFTATTSWIGVSKDCSKTNGAPLLLFAGNKLPGFFGFFIGTLLAALTITVLPEAFTYITIVLVALTCISSTVFELLLYEDTLDGEVTPSEAAALLQAKELMKCSMMKSALQEYCERIADEHHLSEREKEVFYLLAIGRNTEYISNALCIARPTTKTHVKHVYQKFVVNSHQELLDLVNLQIHNSH